MPRGGQRDGSGRPEGAVSKRTDNIKLRVAQLVANGTTPLEHLWGIMNTPKPTRLDKEEDDSFNKRLKEHLLLTMDAAKALLSYVHPKLATIETKQDESQFEREQKAKNADPAEVARRVLFILMEAQRKEKQDAQGYEGSEGRGETQEGIRLQ